jgi:alginate O-acetyltransferase complex protein AlgI
MFFNSLTYLAFLVIAVTLYWVLPIKKRWLLLLCASLIFYAFWRIEFVFLIVFSAFVDFYVSLRIFDASTPRNRKIWLVVALFINLGLLAYFKYTYFIVDNISLVGKTIGQNWNFSLGKIILPLGISFYTFVSLSYTIDVYRKLLVPVRDFRVYLTYVMFWPHMIAGPILRGHELITQLVQSTRFNIYDISTGVKLVLAGLFLKVGLADQLAPLVDDAFSLKTHFVGGLDVWTMAFGFGLQIYFDFAGYSLIAIGSARLVGIEFPENFDWPYLASSPRDFWKRWHITLSSWVRDYLYLPLTGARFQDSSKGGIDIQVNGAKNARRSMVFALFLTWFLMGLWHGASWNFALWGLWHAGLIFVYRLLKDRFEWIPKRLQPIVGWCITTPLVMLGWIPFRAGSLEQTFALLGKVLNIQSYRGLAFRENFYLLIFVLNMGMVCLYFLTNSRLTIFQNKLVRHGAEVLALTVMIFTVFIFLKPVKQFIYFQF